MAVLTTLTTAVAGKLAGALSAPLASRLEDMLLGPTERRALEQACREAVETAVRSQQGAGSDDEQIAHVLQILDDVLSKRGRLDIPATDGLVGTGAAATWSAALDRLGYDPETLPLTLDAFVKKLQQVLPTILRSHGARSGKALFRGIVLDDLDWLRGEVRQILDASVGRAGASVPLARDMECALNASYKACEAADTMFYTPHLLNSLFKLGDDLARGCFDHVEPGLGDEIDTRLAEYVANPPGKDGFVAFRWVEREDVRRSQDLAVHTLSPVVTSTLLLAGVLDTPSATQRQLRERLGAESFRRLRARAIELHSTSTPASTPGNLFKL
jgi:hypothetical protein